MRTLSLPSGLSHRFGFFQKISLLGVIAATACLLSAPLTASADPFETAGPLAGSSGDISQLNEIEEMDMAESVFNSGWIGEGVAVAQCVMSCAFRKKQAEKRLFKVWTSAVNACANGDPDNRAACMQQHGFGDGTEDSYFTDYNSRLAALERQRTECVAGCVERPY